MHTHITKWGNSLGVRIPRYLAQSLGFEEGTSINISREDDRLVIRKEFNLEMLLAQVTDDNIHEETLTGDMVGKEVW